MTSQKTNPTITVLTITVGFVIIFLASGWKWAVYVAVVVGLLGLLSGTLRQKIDFLWMKLALLLSYIVPNVLLTVIYFLVLCPVALLAKLFRSNNLLRLSNTTDSTFIDRNKYFDKADFEKVW